MSVWPAIASRRGTQSRRSAASPITRELPNGWRTSDLGQLWRPKYFTSTGIAVHGATSVPAYPASHGCARVSVPAMNYIWDANLMPKGIAVWVY